jgi:spermidine synthase
VVTFVIIPPWTPSVEVLNLVPESRPEEGLEIELVDIREGNSATVTVLEKRVSGQGREFKSRALGINGVVVAEGSEGTRTDRLNAYIPLLVHPDPQDVLVMGAAAGLTLDACQRFPVEQVDGVEIVPAVVDVMPLFAEYNGDVVNNPRVNIIVDDARNFLEITDKKYDVIINEAWLSVVTGSTPLYSREFFALVKSRLKPDGIISLGPNKMDKYLELTNSTVLAEFPYGYIWYIPEIDTVMTIATLGPLTFAGVRERWAEAGVAAAMRAVNIGTPDQFLACLVLGPDDVRELTGQGTVCTDDKPVYEYLQSAVYFLDVARQQPEDHDDEKFEQLVRRQPTVAGLMDRCGDPESLIDRRIRTMQLMLQARLKYRQGDAEAAGALLREARGLLSP